MSNLTVQEKRDDAILSALVKNDISKLGDEQKKAYFKNICESLGLNPLTRPFQFLTLQGREVFYATKDCSEQLRKIHGVSTQIVSKSIEDGMFIVHVKAKDKTGREDEEISVIPCGNAKGNDLANLMMKAVTKAKRRVTLSLCGLGILDETELETIPDEIKDFASNPQNQHPLYKDVEPVEVKESQPIKDTPLDEIEAVVDQDYSNYVCKVGKKYAGKRLSDIGQVDLTQYLNWLRDSVEKKGQTLSGDWLEFYETAEVYLKTLQK